MSRAPHFDRSKGPVFGTFPPLPCTVRVLAVSLDDYLTFLLIVADAEAVREQDAYDPNCRVSPIARSDSGVMASDYDAVGNLQGVCMFDTVTEPVVSTGNPAAIRQAASHRNDRLPTYEASAPAPTVLVPFSRGLQNHLLALVGKLSDGSGMTVALRVLLATTGRLY